MDADDVDDDTSTGPMPPEELTDLLANQRRRYALYGLFLCDRRMDLPDLADQVTEWEYGRPGDELPQKRLRVYMSLYHDHVPELEEAGLVRYSQLADALELTDAAGALAPRIERLAREELDAFDAKGPATGADEGL